MANETSVSGFKEMSEHADALKDEVVKAASGISDTLKGAGVDTDRMTEAATERASELQQLIEDEIRARPVRAMGWAAAAGLVLGIMAAR